MISTLGRSYQFCENRHLLMTKYKKWGLIERKSAAALSKHTRRTNSGTALALADGSSGRHPVGLPREEGEGFAEDTAKRGFGEAGHRSSGNY